MDIMLSLNLWFIVALCLAFLVIGVIIGCRMVIGRLYRNEDYRRY